MPLYEYQCDACAHRFEVIQKYSDPPIGTCPACGGEVKKLLSSPAIQFKGSGWYITDYARAGKGDPGKAASGKNEKSEGGSGGSESKTESKTETTKDSKPESKSDSKPSASTPSKD